MIIPPDNRNTTASDLNLEDVKTKIIKFISRFVRTQELHDDDDIFALGFVNSMFAMQLVAFVEKEFDLTVEDEDLSIENFKSINAIAAFVECKTSSSRKV